MGSGKGGGGAGAHWLTGPPDGFTENWLKGELVLANWLTNDHVELMG